MNIDRKAIYNGTLVFIGLYTLHILMVPLLTKVFQEGWKSTAVFGISQILGLATCLLAGYVAARTAGERGFFYGFNVGAFGTLLTALGAVVFSFLFGLKFPFLQSLPFWIFANGFLAAVAGIMTTNFADTQTKAP
ncbi:MAG: hypothetical protein EPN21_17890 [Methylococcaceae bacterium]|nr:MAG: hypothetical protein EPN21_17890 [Methylococcaceae bacterium]